MLALEVNREEILRSRIEIHSAKRREYLALGDVEAAAGELDRIRALRLDLDDLRAGTCVPDDTDEIELEVVDECYTTALGAFQPSIKRPLVRYGIVNLEDLMDWDYGRLSLIPSLKPRHIEQVYSTMAALEMGHLIGMNRPISRTLPEINPYAADLMDGRMPEDCEAVLRDIAYGKITQREASIKLGSKEEESSYGHPHQRAGSLIARHSLNFAGHCLRAFKEQFRRQLWWQGVELYRADGQKRRQWRLRISLRVTIDEAVKKLDATRNAVRGGYSWRGCDLVLIETER